MKQLTLPMAKRKSDGQKDDLTCMMLSSETEQMTQASVGFQEKSEILAVWPPWMNSSSGGPSSASSAFCSSPILRIVWIVSYDLSLVDRSDL